MTAPLVIVGELNPYGADPAFALYHLPRNASGNRLREIMGLPDHAYAALEKVNICTGKWSLPAARTKATYAILFGEGTRLVLLGAKVRAAFFGPPPFGMERRAGCQLLGLPHPSGLNRAWDAPGARARARDVLRELAPEIAWGSA